MYTLHGERSSRRISSRALVFKNEDAKGHRQERNAKSFTWEKYRFNGRPWNIPWGGHMKNHILCNNLFGSCTDVEKKSYCEFLMKRSFDSIQSAWEEMMDWWKNKAQRSVFNCAPWDLLGPNRGQTWGPPCSKSIKKWYILVNSADNTELREA